MTNPAAPILDVAQTQLEIQAGAANGRDAIAVGLLGVDAALVAAVVALEPTLGHRYWQPLLAICVSGLFALAALLQGGVTVGRTPHQLYEELRNQPESEIYRRLIVRIDRAVTTSNRRLIRKAWLLSLSILTIIATSIVTVTTL